MRGKSKGTGKNKGNKKETTDKERHRLRREESGRVTYRSPRRRLENRRR